MRGRRWEWAAALAAVIFSFGLVPVPAGIFAAILAGLAVFIAAVDLDRLVIPDLANAAVLALGLALVLLGADSGGRWLALADALLRAAVAGGAFLLLRHLYARIRGVVGLGLGDVKLAAAGAPWLSWPMLPLAVAMAATAAILALLVRSLLRGERLDRRLELPFGAFLAPALWLAFVLDRTDAIGRLPWLP